ncbi:MAG: hypothetical protein QOE61_4115 [Micromonosporaceae bacterium]|nr:hypothetical protein [Micromonosporaceae bacterium]
MCTEGSCAGQSVPNSKSVEPEGMTGLALVRGMPAVLVVAFEFAAMAAFTWHRFWGGRLSLVVGIVTAVAAAVVPCAWLALVSR